MGNPFGSIFGEEISQTHVKSRVHFQDLDKDPEKTRNPILFVLMFLFCFFLLLLKLFDVTILQGEKLRHLSIENRIREETISAPRGIIYDRNGEKLVRNIPIFISRDGEIFFEKAATEAGNLKESVTRQYIYNDLFSSIIGYVGEVSTDDIQRQKNQKISSITYTAGDVIGKMGVEKSYDDLLRGIDGKQLQEVDASGGVVRVLGRIEPVSGQPLQLTVDTSIQKEVASQMAGKKGAVLVTVPQTGEIVALYSSPSYDPNIFVTNANPQSIFNNTDQPLFNRVIAGLYPPGSTFKIVVSLAALESGVITKDTLFEDTGILTVGQFSFGNWYFLQYGKKEGFINVVAALRRSNDIFFYKTGETLGIQKLSAFAKKIGIGTKTGIDIPGEEVGVMADPAWRQEHGQQWYLGDTYHVAIGQGDLLTTPMDVNRWTNIIASGGKLCRIHAAKKNNKTDCTDLGIKKETIDLIREGMRQACADGGTGWPLFNFKVLNANQKNPLTIDTINFFETKESTTSAQKMVGIPVACKTGTAEFGIATESTHAWFTAFAPVYNPQISVTVLVEGGGEGSSVAAPIAKKIFEQWFSGKTSDSGVTATPTITKKNN
jgi:penicillin-binding protein 2